MSEYESQDEQEIYATLVEINQEPTEMYKILKIANVVSGGGEAKLVIAEGYVYLNGEVETRKRKKIYAGDLINFNGQYFQIALKGETADYELLEQDLPVIENSAIAPVTSDPQKKLEQKSAAEKNKGKKKRKPISF